MKALSQSNPNLSFKDKMAITSTKWNDIQKEKVREAIKEWEFYGKLHFAEVEAPPVLATESPTPLQTKADVRITFDSNFE